MFRCQTNSLVAPTALHVDGITKLGTAAATTLFDNLISEGSDCCVVHSEFTSAHEQFSNTYDDTYFDVFSSSISSIFPLFSFAPHHFTFSQSR